MANPVADRNLLFGINALQNDFITRDALIAAMNAWVLEKHRAIGDILVDRGDLEPLDRALLDQLIDRHLARHGGDPLASLAAITSRDGMADDLRRGVNDPDVLESIAQVSTESQADPHATRAPETVDYIPAGTRFRKVRDHAEGGLGIVFVARDEELNREVALKEIKPKYADNPASQARFLVEAEITGGLEHPGIVPVYGLGHYEDGRPYYAMRFIRGDSLKDALAAFHADKALKDDPGARTLALQKLLRRFLDVCNAVAYAHHRGVLHRDLKPDNVMVGKYGETLVVDWGLAKAVGRSGEDGYGPLPESTILYKPSSGSAETLPGSVIGTPSYMSPEQAAGRLDLLGPASDVYSLGATLYTLLTGQVPIRGENLQDVLRKVERGEFPRPRESTPWLDPALEAVALKAMGREPESRYVSPRALAEDIERWIADEPVAAYPEPFTRRARRWAGKHRTSLTTAVATLLVAALLIGGFGWQRFEKRRQTDAAARTILTKAEWLAIQARTSGQPSTWQEAVAEVLRARERLESGEGSPALRLEAVRRVEAFRAEQAQRAEMLASEVRDRKVVTDLEEARLQGTNFKDGYYDAPAWFEADLSAFQSYGIDITTLPIEEAARRIRASRVADDLIATLDDWARFQLKGLKVPPERLQAIARSAETDPVRATIREAISHRDLATLRRLCESEEDRRKLGRKVYYLFDSLLHFDPAGSFLVLENILRENPSDFWFNHDLGQAYRNARPPRRADAVHLLSVAVALRPKSPGAHLNLGNALQDQGELDKAISEFKIAIRIQPDYSMAHNNFGNALRLQGHLEQAVDEFNTAIRIQPQFAMAHHNLGVALRVQGQLDRAIAEHNVAIRIQPEYADAHYGLGNALDDRSQSAEAAAAYATAIRIQPQHAEAHYALGNVFFAQGQLDQAVAKYATAIQIKPEFAMAHNNLANGMYLQGKLDRAFDELAAAIRIQPEYAEAHNNLGIVLRAQGQPNLAIVEFKNAIRIRPDYAEPHFNLGSILLSTGKYGEALEPLKKSNELGSKRPDWRLPSEALLGNARRLVDLEAKLLAVLVGAATPKDFAERLVLAKFCHEIGRYATSARFWGEAFAETPASSDDLEKSYRYDASCAASLAASGQGKDEPIPDNPAKIKLREQALSWLRADLMSWEKVVDGGKEPASKEQVAKTLAYWKEDADLAGIRDEAALAKLPDGEREGFRALWEDVDRLLAKARAGSP